MPFWCVQASIGRDAGVAVITALYMGLFLWLRPFRTRHRSRLCTSCIARPTCAMTHPHLTAFARWKLVPRVALLAFTILAATVNISQRSSSSHRQPNHDRTECGALRGRRAAARRAAGGVLPRQASRRQRACEASKGAENKTLNTGTTPCQASAAAFALRAAAIMAGQSGESLGTALRVRPCPFVRVTQRVSAGGYPGHQTG